MRHSWRPVVPRMVGAVDETPVEESTAHAGPLNAPSTRTEPKTTLAPTDREGLRKAAIVIRKSPNFVRCWRCLRDTPRVHSNAGEEAALSEHHGLGLEADAEAPVDAFLDRL